MIQPWTCHLSVVFLVSFILARYIKSQSLTILVASSVGVLFAGCLMTADFVPDGWLEADAYWNDHTQMWRALSRTLKGKGVRDPQAATRGLLMFWTAPLVLSWVTVRVRTPDWSRERE